MVYGKATDDSLDIDQQICDADWLKRAMPEWFETGGNIREQHSSIAAGVATGLENRGSAFYIKVHVVDPVSVLKVKTNVLKGFSVGIKNPRVIHDEKAANGRIVDGIIVEVSLVDRPANPTCQLVLAKSVSGQSTLVKVEEIIEKEAAPMTKEEVLAYAKTLVGDTVKFDAGLYETARTALAQLVIVESQEMVDGDNETDSLNALINAISALDWWYRGEEAAGETRGEHHEGEMKMPNKDMDAEAEAAAKKKESDADAEADAAAKKKKESDADAEADAAAKKKESDAEADAMAKKKESDADADADAEAAKKKDADAEAMCDKCGMKEADCKCADKAEGLGEQNSGPDSSANMDTATIVSPKSAEAETPAEAAEVPAEPATEVSSEEAPALSEEEIEAIVEKAVKSAVTFVKAEATKALAAKEAAESRIASLEEELAKAKSLAVAGGPRRTAKPVDVAATENLYVKAAYYRAKAQATTDPDLAKGWAEKANELLKAATGEITK